MFRVHIISIPIYLRFWYSRKYWFHDHKATPVLTLSWPFSSRCLALTFFFFFNFYYLDEICGIYSEQQYNRWPLPGICESERTFAFGYHFGSSQSAHWLSHICGLSGCCRCLQIHIGKSSGQIFSFLFRNQFCSTSVYMFSLWSPFTLN